MRFELARRFLQAATLPVPLALALALLPAKAHAQDATPGPLPVIAGGAPYVDRQRGLSIGELVGIALRASPALHGAPLVTAPSAPATSRERLLERDVRNQAARVLAGARTLAALDVLLQMGRATATLITARMAQGLSPTTDLYQLNIEIARLESERALESGRTDAALIALKALSGREPDSLLVLRDDLDALVASISVAQQDERSRQRSGDLAAPLNTGHADDLAARAELAASSVRLRQARLAVESAAKARDIARDVAGIAAAVYEQRRGTLIDVLAERRRYVEMEKLYTAALFEAAQADAALRAAGGGVE